MAALKKKTASIKKKQKKRDTLKDVIKLSVQPSAKAINQPEKSSKKTGNKK